MCAGYIRELSVRKIRGGEEKERRSRRVLVRPEADRSIGLVRARSMDLYNFIKRI